MAFIDRHIRPQPSASKPQVVSEPAAAVQSPVHALHGSIAASWSPGAAGHPASAQKQLPLGRLAAIAAFAAFAWTPVAAVALVVAR